MLNISKGKINRAIKTVIYGSEGIGKSTFASHFPDPLFIDTEGGTAQLDVRRIEKPKTWDELVDIVNEVAATPGICKTLVIDTADWAEQLCIRHVCEKYKQSSIESFGYGKGYTYIGEEWSRLLAACEGCIKSGKNIVLVAHAKQRKQELPDEAGAFDRWEMKLSRQVAPLLKEWADLLLFLNYKTYVVQNENKVNKATGGKRVIYTTHHPCWDAKNRHGLPEEIDLDYSNIAHIFEGQEAQEDPVKEEPPAPDPVQRESVAKLLALLESNGIEIAQLQEVVASKGHYPIDVPVDQYSDKFINGWCIKHFDKIIAMIKEDK